jgi:hypothetical protein
VIKTILAALTLLSLLIALRTLEAYCSFSVSHAIDRNFKASNV